MKRGRTKTELSPLEKFCLDAYLTNGDSRLAYILSRKEPEVTASENSIPVQTSRWMSSDKVKDYLALRRTVATTNAEVQEITNRSRDDTISELNRLASASTNPKEKAQILLALADLQKWKREDLGDKEKQVLFYIPLPIDKAIEYNARKLAEAFGWDEETESKAVKIMRESPGKL